MKISLHRIVRNAAAVLSLGGLALCNFNDSMLVVYDPSPLTRFRKLLLYGEGLDEVRERFLKGVIALRWNNKYKAAEVDAVVAKQGFGPLIYLAAMQVYHDDGLIPNQTGSITAEAKKVWQEFFEGAGADLVRSEPIEGNFRNQEDFLNQRYFIDKPLSNFQSALQKHHRALGSEDRHGELFDGLVTAAQSWIDWEMHQIYSLDD